MLKLKLQYSGHLMWELTHWKRPWSWERLKPGGEGDDRGWDGWMAPPTRWTWVWASSRSWWWTGKPGMWQSMGSQSQTRLRDWTELSQSVHTVAVLLHTKYRWVGTLSTWKSGPIPLPFSGRVDLGSTESLQGRTLFRVALSFPAEGETWAWATGKMHSSPVEGWTSLWNRWGTQYWGVYIHEMELGPEAPGIVLDEVENSSPGKADTREAMWWDVISQTGKRGYSDQVSYLGSAPGESQGISCLWNGVRNLQGHWEVEVKYVLQRT